MLRNVINLPFLEVEVLNEAVQFPGRDSAGGGLVDLADEREELLEAEAGACREEDHGRVLEEFEGVADLLFEFSFFLAAVALDFVPLVDAVDERAAALMRVAGDGGVEADHA